MRAPSFIRNLSLHLSTVVKRGSSVVVPLPESSQFSQEITTELDSLQSSEYQHGSASWVANVLDATIATQKLAKESLSVINVSNLSNMDKEMIEDYLDTNVELLDACNGLVEKIDVFRNYVDSFKSALRLLDGSSKPTVSTRAREALDRCDKLKRQCSSLDKSAPNLRRLMGNNAWQKGQDLELHEILSGSNEVALVVCHFLQRALSFKSNKQGLVRMKSKGTTTWSNSLNELQFGMNELEDMLMASRMLHDQMKSQKGNIDIDSLRRSCEALEGGMKPLEERIRELYRHLISVRMALLGILSQN